MVSRLLNLTRFYVSIRIIRYIIRIERYILYIGDQICNELSDNLIAGNDYYVDIYAVYASVQGTVE